ncbi:hypothetical protein AA313_de0201448 [Arthrobotrys entomopaga]|nr:hypothetical protein AA313_de0201448 [Arthrobotrys entomopaga]
MAQENKTNVKSPLQEQGSIWLARQVKSTNLTETSNPLLPCIKSLTREEFEKRLQNNIRKEGDANPQVQSSDKFTKRQDQMSLPSEEGIGRLAKRLMLPKNKKRRAKWESLFQGLSGKTIEQAAEQQNERERQKSPKLSFEKN